MRLCTCVGACMHARARVCTRMRVRVHAHLRKRVCDSEVYVCLCGCLCMFVRACVCACVYVFGIKSILNMCVRCVLVLCPYENLCRMFAPSTVLASCISEGSVTENDI